MLRPAARALRHKLETFQGYADPAALVPVGDEASALAVADEVGLEPAGEPMLTGRGDEPVGDEHEGAVGERNAFGPPEVLVGSSPPSRSAPDAANGPPSPFAQKP